MISNLIEEDEQSVGGALFQTAQQLTISISICLSSLTSTEVQKHTGSLYKGVRAAGFLNGSVGMLAPVICVLALRHIGIGRDVGEQVREEERQMRLRKQGVESGQTTRVPSLVDGIKA